MDVLNAIDMSREIMSYRDVFLELNPEKFKETVEGYKDGLTKLKNQNKNNSYIQTIIPIAQKMSDAYKDPGLLIAIAVELDLRDKKGSE